MSLCGYVALGLDGYVQQWVLFDRTAWGQISMYFCDWGQTGPLPGIRDNTRRALRHFHYAENYKDEDFAFSESEHFKMTSPL